MCQGVPTRVPAAAVSDILSCKCKVKCKVTIRVRDGDLGLPCTARVRPRAMSCRCSSAAPPLSSHRRPARELMTG